VRIAYHNQRQMQNAQDPWYAFFREYGSNKRESGMVWMTIARISIATWLVVLGAPLDVLVDSHHPLPPWYAPGEREEARQALDQMLADFDFPVEVRSDYRSYDLQLEAYERLVKEQGQERADQVIARPGYSEHQLGTAFDLSWAGLPIEWDEPRNRALWMALEEHAHEYGFVISYPLKETSEWPYSNRWVPVGTDFRWEPWHVRYVGKNLAAQMRQAGYLDPSNPLIPQDFYQAWP